jgi:hypothetical protein
MTDPADLLTDPTDPPADRDLKPLSDLISMIRLRPAGMQSALTDRLRALARSHRGQGRRDVRGPRNVRGALDARR